MGIVSLRLSCGRIVQEIDYRLASLCEEIEGYKKWRVLIRKDLNFSDGKKITPSDVIEAIKESNLTHFIKKEKGQFPTKIIKRRELSMRSPYYKVVIK